MPEFGAALSAATRQQLFARVTELVRAAPNRQEIKADEYVLEPEAAVAVDEATWQLVDGTAKLAVSRAEFRPPFEWLAEVTLELPGDPYFRHYLIRENDVTWALRRTLEVIDEAEAAAIMAALAGL